MDILVISTGTCSFILFLVLQIAIFRHIDSRKLMKWLMIIFISVFLIHTTVFLFSYPMNLSGSEKFRLFIESYFLATSIYALLSFIYVSAVFGITVTSVRIQIMRTIFNHGARGMTLKEILSIYNRDVIIGTRLERLVGSGELEVSNGQYRIKHKLSLFMVHTYFLVLLGLLYDTKKVSVLKLKLSL
jgi:hypothetical protein